MLSALRTRAAVVPRLRTSIRTIATSLVRRSDDHGSHGPPIIVGEGGKAGEVPTALQQATGIERLELLGKIEGVDVFDMKPLEMTRLGTLDNPIEVNTLAHQRLVGCTGFPADSHDTLWLRCTTDRKANRCPECGCVYRLKYLGPEDSGHGHH